MLLTRRLWRSPAIGVRRGYISVDDLIFGEPGLSSDPKPPNKLKDFYPVSKKVNGKFVSPWSKSTNKHVLDVLKLLLSKKRPPLKFSTDVDQDFILHPVEVDRAKMRSVAQPHLSWFGHASCYFQSDDMYFLTDPVWGERVSPFSFFGPKRYIRPPIELEDLKIDVVLISHTHYDHLDVESVKRIGNRAHWVVPLGVKAFMESNGITNCTELDWWQNYHYINSTGKTAEIIFCPTKHWTSRTPFDRNTCLWGSYAVKAGKTKFFFTGDTAYCEVFKLIGEKFGPFDVAAVPIGAYSPRWFMKDVHCNPGEAVQIHEDLRAKQSAAIHWGTYRLTDEDKIEPALELARVRDLRNLPAEKFFTMAHGETWIVGEKPAHDLASKYPNFYEEYLKLKRHESHEHVSEHP